MGDIRQRLGQLDEAEAEYARVVEKLTALSARPDAGADVCVELARTCNELGNVRSARFQSRRICFTWAQAGPSAMRQGGASARSPTTSSTARRISPDRTSSCIVV